MTRTITSGNAAGLLSLIARAFSEQQRALPQRTSKYRPLGVADTGHLAATTYISRRNVSASSPSSLRKLQRAMRISEGLRPQQYEVLGKRERKVLAKIERRFASAPKWDGILRAGQS